MRKIGFMAVAAWLWAAGTLVIASTRQEAALSQVVIGVQNLARLSPRELSSAKAEAAEVFQKAGVKLEWVEMQIPPEGVAALSPELPGMSAYLTLPPPQMVSFLSEDRCRLGFAAGNRVWVFSERVRLLALEADVPYPVVLGHVMAHEIGHVLLGPNSHFPTGIMAPHFGTAEIRDISRGLLRFNPNQAAQMRQRLARM